MEKRCLPINKTVMCFRVRTDNNCYLSDRDAILVLRTKHELKLWEDAVEERMEAGNFCERIAIGPGL